MVAFFKYRHKIIDTVFINCYYNFILRERKIKLLNDFKLLFKKPFLLISVLITAAIPLIYTATFLGSMWDPYSNMDEMEIAVVNEDTGSEMNGEDINVGEDVIDNLQDNDDFNWQVMDKDKADQHLEDGDAFGIVVIPENASEVAGQMLEDGGEAIDLELYTNPGFNYMGSVIGSQAGNGISEEISTSVTEMYTSALVSNLDDVYHSNGDIIEGLDELNEGTSDLIDANEELQDGLESAGAVLGEAGEQLIAGNSEITGGLEDLQNGQEDMRNQVEEGNEEFSDFSLTEDNAELIANPVNVNENEIVEINNYGQNFAPFIAAVSIFLGAVAYSVIYPVNRKTDFYPNFMSMFVSKSLLLIVHGVIAAALLFLVVHFGFEMEIKDEPRFYLMITLWSVASILFVTLLVNVLGNVGKFIAIVLLILQLSSSAGTFPIDTAHAFYQTIHPYLPMSYAITAMRESIFEFEAVMTYGDAVIYMSVIIFTSLLLMLLVAFLKFKLPAFDKISNKLGESES
jgi:putative membrane protein